MNLKPVLSLVGLLAILLVFWSFLPPGRGPTRDLLEFDAGVLVRLQEAHFLDFYRYTTQMDRLGFQASDHVQVQTALTPDRLGWSSVLTDDRLPGQGCAVYGGVVESPLPSPGGSVPDEAGAPVCDPSVPRR